MPARTCTSKRVTYSAKPVKGGRVNSGSGIANVVAWAIAQTHSICACSHTCHTPLRRPPRSRLIGDPRSGIFDDWHSPDCLKRIQAQTATKPSPEPSSSGADMLQARNQPIQDERPWRNSAVQGMLSRQSLTATARCQERVMLFLVRLPGQDAGRPT
ncbi:hypothetical protein B0T18DRAFT_225829 [Schizothecium vesticola]|uniref:Uncharacterized protein n=1 Tax=Schizothecium vesticola TaxID=314040 RepID=A0AA40EKS3_9PEZI|nr:hypothetical protein B0T18DRAFT_225829 [Schizothecium vesticola]